MTRVYSTSVEVSKISEWLMEKGMRVQTLEQIGAVRMSDDLHETHWIIQYDDTESALLHVCRKVATGSFTVEVTKGIRVSDKASRLTDPVIEKPPGFLMTRIAERWCSPRR